MSRSRFRAVRREVRGFLKEIVLSPGSLLYLTLGNADVLVTKSEKGRPKILVWERAQPLSVRLLKQPFRQSVQKQT